MKLTIELVPQTCWYSNVRSNVTPQTWDRLQSITFRSANYHCETCGGTGRPHPVECHEIWHYDDHRCIQRLAGLIALCPKCHQVKHIGHAIHEGKTKDALEWLASVNNISPAEALRYVQQCLAIHKVRSTFVWTLDISVLTEKYGVKLDRYGFEIGLNRSRK